MGWNGSGKKPQTFKAMSSPNCKRKYLRYAILGLSFLGIIYVYLNTINKDELAEAIDSETPHVKMNRTKKTKKVSDYKVSSKTRTSTNLIKKSNSKINMASLDIEAREEIIEKKIISHKIADVSSNGQMRSVTENVIANIFTKRLGDVPPPLPPIPLHEEFRIRELIENLTPPTKDDTDEQSYRKDTVKIVKDKLSEYLKEGGTVTDFLAYYHAELKEANKKWKKFQLEAIRSINEDPDVAPLIIQELNSKLEADGIKPLEIPEPLLNKIQIVNEEEK